MFNTCKHPKIKAIKITNTATVKVNGTSQASANVTFLVAKSADLSITTIKPMHIGYVGQNILYVIKVTNKGLYKATGIVLTDILPRNSICSYINFTQGTYKYSKNRITFYLGELHCNANAIVVISIIPKSPCILTNHAFVTASEHDKNWNNNVSTTNTKVYCMCPTLFYFY